MKSDPISSEEMTWLQMMPFLAAEILLGKPNGTIEERVEGHRLVWHMDFSEVQTVARNAAAHPGLVFDVFRKILSDPGEVQSAFFLAFGLVDPFDLLRKTAAILDSKASPAEAAEMKNIVIHICLKERSVAGLASLGRAMTNSEFRGTMDQIVVAMNTSIDWSHQKDGVF